MFAGSWQDHVAVLEKQVADLAVRVAAMEAAHTQTAQSVSEVIEAMPTAQQQKIETLPPKAD